LNTSVQNVEAKSYPSGFDKTKQRQDAWYNSVWILNNRTAIRLSLELYSWFWRVGITTQQWVPLCFFLLII